MPMGYSACYAHVISEEQVRQVVPEYAQFEEHMAKLCHPWREVADEFLQGDRQGLEDHIKEFIKDEEIVDVPNTEEGIKEAIDTLGTLWESITKLFEERTGATLHLEYHDQENAGDVYDEVAEEYFWVGGLYEPSPALEKLRKMGVDPVEQRWVVHG